MKRLLLAAAALFCCCCFAESTTMERALRELLAVDDSAALPACDTLTTLLPRWRRLHSSSSSAGFHPRLAVEFAPSSAAAPPPPVVIVVETLPRGAFADVYQLRSLRLDAAVVVANGSKSSAGEMDLEAPLWDDARALPAIVAWRWRRNSSSLPIHLRYHRASLGAAAAATVVVPAPKVFAACRSSRESGVRWTKLPPAAAEDEAISVFEVPVGNASDAWLVTLATYAATALGALAIGIATQQQRR